jgi:hypothetical protein
MGNHYDGVGLSAAFAGIYHVGDDLTAANFHILLRDIAAEPFTNAPCRNHDDVFVCLFHFLTIISLTLAAKVQISRGKAKKNRFFLSFIA